MAASCNKQRCDHEKTLRSSRRRILPDGVRGTASTKRISRGCLWWARRSATKLRSSWSSVSDGSKPSRRTTKAQGISPAAASGRATTPQSRTAGCSSSNGFDFGWGHGESFVLDHLLAAVENVVEALGIGAHDVAGKYHPSRRTAAVACGSFQYPIMNCGPRMTSSPCSPGATSLPSRSTTRHSVRARGCPMEAGRVISGG